MALWNDAGTLRWIANLLFGLALALAVYGAVATLVRLPAFTLRELRIDGGPARVAAAEIEAVVSREAAGTFFTVDLEAVRKGLERIPWVRTATVRREWPARLAATVEEHRPLARWADGGLVNTRGEQFQAPLGEPLPVLGGPPGSAAELARQYGQFSRMLAPTGQRIAQLTLSARGAWQVKLAGGMVLELGREDVQARLARFVAVYRHGIAPLAARPEYVDLRYRDGLAVRMPAGAELRQPRKPARSASNGAA
jgi:cell division protein FtsQ